MRSAEMICLKFPNSQKIFIFFSDILKLARNKKMKKKWRKESLNLIHSSLQQISNKKNFYFSSCHHVNVVEVQFRDFLAKKLFFITLHRVVLSIRFFFVCNFIFYRQARSSLFLFFVLNMIFVKRAITFRWWHWDIVSFHFLLYTHLTHSTLSQFLFHHDIHARIFLFFKFLGSSSILFWNCVLFWNSQKYKLNYHHRKLVTQREQREKYTKKTTKKTKTTSGMCCFVMTYLKAQRKFGPQSHWPTPQKK